MLYQRKQRCLHWYEFLFPVWSKRIKILINITIFETYSKIRGERNSCVSVFETYLESKDQGLLHLFHMLYYISTCKSTWNNNTNNYLDNLNEYYCKTHKFLIKMVRLCSVVSGISLQNGVMLSVIVLKTFPCIFAENSLINHVQEDGILHVLLQEDPGLLTDICKRCLSESVSITRLQLL